MMCYYLNAHIQGQRVNLRGLKLQNTPNSERIPELKLEPEKSEYYEAEWGTISFNR